MGAPRGAHCRWWPHSGGRAHGKSRVPAVQSGLHPLPAPQLALASLALGFVVFFLLSSGCFSSPTLLLKGQMARRCLGRRGQLSPWAAAPARPLPLPPASRQGLRSGRGAAGQGGGAAEQQEGRAGLSVARGLGAAAQRAEPRLGPTSGDSAAQQAAAPAGQTVLCRLQRGHAGPRAALWPGRVASRGGCGGGSSSGPVSKAGAPGEWGWAGPPSPASHLPGGEAQGSPGPPVPAPGSRSYALTSCLPPTWRVERGDTDPLPRAGVPLCVMG